MDVTSIVENLKGQKKFEGTKKRLEREKETAWLLQKIKNKIVKFEGEKTQTFCNKKLIFVCFGQPRNCYLCQRSESQIQRFTCWTRFLCNHFRHLYTPLHIISAVLHSILATVLGFWGFPSFEIGSNPNRESQNKRFVFHYILRQ